MKRVSWHCGVGDLPEIVCCNRIHGYTPPQEYRVCGYRCCCIRLFLRHAPATSFQVYPDTPPQEICNRINCIRITSTRRHTFKNCNRIHLRAATGSTCNRIHGVSGSTATPQPRVFGVSGYTATRIQSLRIQM